MPNTAMKLEQDHISPSTGSSMTPRSNPRKPRKRVPISCLNCKKRKVKCDKVKPACGGCVKNQVPHLCQYVEPAWADKNEMPTVPSSAVPSSVRSIDTAQSNEEYKQYKCSSEKTIQTQRKEIENLKRQLSVLREFAPKILVDNETPNSLSGSPITVLHKLKPPDIEMHDQVMLRDDTFFSFHITAPKQSASDKCIYVYQWVNIIKLDPQLTNLWYKITNLQKVYHLYKFNQISAKQKQPRSAVSSAISSSAPKRPTSKVNEIDFTSMFSRSSSSIIKDGTFAPKCPVIECDFNFMADDDQTTSLASRSQTPETKPDSLKQKLFSKAEVQHAKSYYNVMADDATGLLKRLRYLWDAMINLVRGNEKLNYKQLRFLIDFYLSANQLDSESKNLVNFYRRELNWVFKKQDDSIVVDLSVSSDTVSDEDAYGLLKMKGVYLAMLSLLVEESLDLLRSSVESGSSSPFTLRFKELFPSEVFFQGLGYKGNNILFSIQEVLTSLHNSLMRTCKLNYSLAFAAVSICYLNRHISLYRRQGTTISDIKPGFTAIWTLLTSLITNRSDAGVQIWKDPSLVNFEGSEARKKELKVHLCYVWSDVVRLVNLIVFESVGLVKGKAELSGTILELYGIIQECEASHSHIRYLARLKSEDYGHLTVSFHVNYLIARSFIVLNSAILKSGDILVTVSTFQRVINETKIWSNGSGISKLRYVRFFEAKVILMYLEFFLTYICLLQGEEIVDDSVTSNTFPKMFDKCTDLNIALQKFTTFDEQTLCSQYILSVITEVLSRSVQLIVGIMIRFRPGDDPSSLVYTQLPKSAFSIDVHLKEKLIGSTENTVTALLQSQLLDKKKVIRLSKLWSFYLTFINSSKMSSMNYATMHANVPGVKGMFSKGMDKCPAIADETTRSTDATSSTKCPISHITEPISNNLQENHVFDSKLGEHKTGRCPIDHSALTKNIASEVKTVGTKRKCPFDHESLKGGLMPKGFHESHVRGSAPEPSRKKQPWANRRDSSAALTTGSPAPLASYPSLVHDSPQQATANRSTKETTKPTGKEDGPEGLLNNPVASESTPFAGVPTPLSGASQAINFNDLSDFDFDFLQNDSWFEQFDMVNADNTIIEGLFQ